MRLTLCVAVLMASPCAMAQDCLTDAQIEQAVGTQVRAGAFFVDTRHLPDRPLCSGLTLAQHIQRMRAEAFPPAPPEVIEAAQVPEPPTHAEMVQPVVDAMIDNTAPASKAMSPRTESARPKPIARKIERPSALPARAPSRAFYRSCREARAAGAAPIRRGQSGYGRHLDRDGDGIACE
jgi:hypothetical protein